MEEAGTGDLPVDSPFCTEIGLRQYPVEVRSQIVATSGHEPRDSELEGIDAIQVSRPNDDFSERTRE